MRLQNTLSAAKVVLTTICLVWAAGVAAADLPLGSYRYWKLPAEAATTTPVGKSSGGFCVTAANAGQTALLVGQRAGDSDCTLTRPLQTNSTTETFNMTCGQGKSSAAVSVVKSPNKFVSTVTWNSDQTTRKYVVVGLLEGACTK